MKCLWWDRIAYVFIITFWITLFIIGCVGIVRCVVK